MAEFVYTFLWWLGLRLEDLADFVKRISTKHWAGVCEHCGIEGGYGHKKGCPNLSLPQEYYNLSSDERRGQ